MASSSEVLCSICFEEASQWCSKTVVTLKCSHKFHLDCIGSFFNYRGNMQCPNCRAIENGEWQRPGHNLPSVVNQPNLERITGSQGQRIEGSSVNGLPRQQPLSEYGTTNYSINSEAGHLMTHAPHYGYHDITDFHHNYIYYGISPDMNGSTSGNSSSVPPFDDAILTSNGFDNQDTITDYPLTLVDHHPPIMNYETIGIDWNNTRPMETLNAFGMDSNADAHMPYPGLLVHEDIEVHSQTNSRSQTCQRNATIQIITISDNDDDNDDAEQIIISDDE